MRKSKAIVLLSLVLLVSFMAVPMVRVSAKNLNLPPGADKVIYYDAAGQADVALPTPLPAGFPSSATAMRLSFAHVEIPNDHLSYNVLSVWLYLIPSAPPGSPPNTVRSWVPYALITTNSADAAFEATLWYGSFVKFNATLYGAPAIYGTNNVFVVSDDVLNVDRHGNDVTLTLNAPIQIKRVLAPPTATFTLPAFSLQLNNYGEPIFDVSTHLWTGYLAASQYTMIQDEMQFNANGVFSSAESRFDGAVISNALVIMRGIHTFYPPA